MNRGLIFGFLAAFFNATVGLFSMSAFLEGMSPVSVSFYKCLLAFVVLSIYILVTPDYRKNIKIIRKHWMKVALLGMFGIFTLYFFETAAYQLEDIALVVFALQGSSTLTTFIASYFWLGTRYDSLDWLGMVLALAGLSVLFISEHSIHSLSFGLLLSCIAGSGYGLFLVFSKKAAIPTDGVTLLWGMLLFGCLLLLVPFSLQPWMMPSLFGWGYITALSLLGTIGGFFFTIKALSLLDAAKVQLCELSEPVFASVLAFLVFGQLLSKANIIGALIIFFAIYILNRPKNDSVVAVEGIS